MLTYRSAPEGDIPLLVDLNQHLIEDEEYTKRYSNEELTSRWRHWLAGGYHAVIFEREGSAAGYALYRFDEEGSIYLRQFFVCRHCRRQGVGREAMRLLREDIWPSGQRILLDVLLHNERGLRFWRAVGFEDYALMLQYNRGWDRRARQ